MRKPAKLIATLTLAVLSIVTVTARAKTIENYASNYAIDYTNVFFNNGYTLNYNQNYIDQCNAKVAGTPNPTGEIYYSKVSNPVLVQRRQDPYGRGYYDDMKMQCSATFINPNVDCTNGGVAYGSGEIRSEVTQDLVDCLTITTKYTCSNTVWNVTSTTYTKIPRCVPR